MGNLLFEGGFDQLDHTILEELQRNGRVSVADLSRQIHLSPPAVYQRIKRLEKAGIVRRYVALLDREAAGYDVLGFVRLFIQPHTPTHIQQFQAAIEKLPTVLECYRLAGSHDILLKIIARNNRELDQFITQHLMTIPGVERIETSVALHEMKNTTAIKIKS
jgi:Lrp/AsnC family transcriptional regulator, leucine-responsive regulatory protein